MKTLITTDIKKTIAFVALCLFAGSSLNAQMLCNATFTHQPGNTVNSVHFSSAANSSTATIYAWSFGDGGTSTVANPTHTYAPGNYLACLTVTLPSSNGSILCTATFCDSVHVGATTLTCNAHFTHTGVNNTANGISFTSSLNPVGTAYAWTFGDGGTSNVPNPTHTYAPGHYLACLTVTYSNPAGNNCTATFCDSIHVNATTLTCNAHFTHTQVSGVLGMLFTSSPNPTGTVYAWTFGDGGTANIPNPTHVYAPGHYLACLTVIAPSTIGAPACTSTFCDSIHINPVAVNCNASFTHQATSAGEHFTSAANPAGTVYLWSFGDGGTSNNANPTHLYAPGHYQVCLTVTVYSNNTNTILCTATHCDSIHIGNNTPNCTANFNYHHLSAALTYGFNNLSSPNATGYFWHFGDATTSTQTNPVHHYMVAGQYQVCVTMFDTVHHCSKTSCKNIQATVMMSPQATSFAKVANENTDVMIVSVYPNPASENATIHIENANSLVNFKLFDNTGRLASQKSNLTNGDFELNNADFAAGMYYYQVTGENNMLVSGKLMIQK